MFIKLKRWEKLSFPIENEGVTKLNRNKGFTKMTGYSLLC